MIDTEVPSGIIDTRGGHVSTNVRMIDEEFDPDQPLLFYGFFIRDA